MRNNELDFNLEEILPKFKPAFRKWYADRFLTQNLFDDDKG